MRGRTVEEEIQTWQVATLTHKGMTFFSNAFYSDVADGEAKVYTKFTGRGLNPGADKAFVVSRIGGMVRQLAKPVTVGCFCRMRRATNEEATALEADFNRRKIR